MIALDAEAPERCSVWNRIMHYISELIRNCIWNLLLFFNHSSVRLTGSRPENISGKIVVSLHRNGMLDLFLVRYLWPEVVALTSVQWHQNPLTRWLIGGVAVTRGKDRNKKIKAENYEALDRCVDLLKSGRAVGIAPEGTSQLGPGHLQFQKAAARVAAKALESQAEIRVVPVSPVYLKAWGWRSPAELYVGPELLFKAGQSMNEIHREIAGALSAISLKAPDFDSLMNRQAAAWELSRCLTELKKPFSELLLEGRGEALSEMARLHQEAVAKTAPQPGQCAAVTQVVHHHCRPDNRRPGDSLRSRRDDCGFNEHLTFFGALNPGVKTGKNREEPEAWPISFLFRLALCGSEAVSLSARLLVWPALALSRVLRRPLVDDLNVVALWRGLVALPLIALWLLAAASVCACFSPLLFPLPLLWALLAVALEPWRRRCRALIKTDQALGAEGRGFYAQKIIAAWNAASGSEPQAGQCAAVSPVIHHSRRSDNHRPGDSLRSRRDDCELNSRPTLHDPAAGALVKAPDETSDE